MLSYNDSLANPAASGGYCARFRGSIGLQRRHRGSGGVIKPPLCLILPAGPWVPFREIVVIGLPWGACALKLAAILPHPYAAKYGWQAHPAWDAARSVEEPRRVVGVVAEMQATGRLPVLAAAVAPGGSSTVQPRGCVTDELKVRASTGRLPVLAAAVVASDDSPAVQPRGCESDELIIRASEEQAA
jgi:hypothetical protein